MREIFMHLTGFEPVTFLRKRIMSPVPSTTRPQMRWSWWELNPRPVREKSSFYDKRKFLLCYFSLTFVISTLILSQHLLFTVTTHERRKLMVVPNDVKRMLIQGGL